MFLTTVADIRDSLGFDDMVDINAAIEAAAHAATEQLEARLSTDFTKATHTDVFWVPEPGFIERPHCETEFRLTHGILVGPVVVTGGVNYDELGTDGFDYGKNLISDTTRGIIRNVGTFYNNQYVKFTYTAGFEADDIVPDQYKLDDVPDWLQQAAIKQTMINLKNAPSIKSAEIEIDDKMLALELSHMLKNYIRYAPSALLPI